MKIQHAVRKRGVFSVLTVAGTALAWSACKPKAIDGNSQSTVMTTSPIDGARSVDIFRMYIPLQYASKTYAIQDSENTEKNRIFMSKIYGNLVNDKLAQICYFSPRDQKAAEGTRCCNVEEIDGDWDSCSVGVTSYALYISGKYDQNKDSFEGQLSFRFTDEAPPYRWRGQPHYSMALAVARNGNGFKVTAADRGQAKNNNVNNGRPGVYKPISDVIIDPLFENFNEKSGMIGIVRIALQSNNFIYMPLGKKYHGIAMEQHNTNPSVFPVPGQLTEDGRFEHPQ